MGRDDYNPKMDTGIDGESGAVKPPGTPWGCWGCLGVVVLVFVVTGIFTVAGSGSGADNEAAVRQVMAQRACEDEVRGSLKAPATSKFSGTRATSSGAGYRVTGSVDAENSFGAMLRNSFECSVSFSGGAASATLISLG